MAESGLAVYAYTAYGRLVGPRTIVTPDPDRAYVIGKIHSTTSASANTQVAWVKWTRTGGVWASGSVQTVSSTPGGCVACWYDRWTPGNTGDKIHVIFHQERSGTEGIYYFNIDLASSDAVSTPVLLESIAAGNASTFSHSVATIIVARSGRLYVAGVLDDTVSARRGFWSSDNGGATWSILDDTPMQEETGSADYFEMFPGGETNTNDVLLVQLDRSANTVDLWTYDASGDTWGSKTNITACADDSNYIQLAGVQRHSDNHVLLAVVNSHDLSTTDLEFWDITNAGSMTRKTDVWSNSADRGCVAVACLQQTDEIFVTWVQGDSAWPGSSNIVHQRWSSDGGSTWDSITQPNTTSRDISGVYVAGYSVGDEGGQIGAAWFDDVNNTLWTDFDEWLEVPPFTGGFQPAWARHATQVAGIQGVGGYLA